MQETDKGWTDYYSSSKGSWGVQQVHGGRGPCRHEEAALLLNRYGAELMVAQAFFLFVGCWNIKCISSLQAFKRRARFSHANCRIQRSACAFICWNSASVNTAGSCRAYSSQDSP